MRIGIVTLYRGLNYGTSLQAYAIKHYMESLGYEADIIWTKENTQGSRDVRIIKIVRILSRIMVHPKLLKHTIKAYAKSVSNPIGDTIKKKFRDFTYNELNVLGMSREELKKYSEDSQTVAIVCGSDQIWSTTDANVEPLYYLQFAPKFKRIAYAPSFGAASVPKYNKKIITKYLQSIPAISVREDQGAEIVEKLIGKRPPVLIDPTLLLDWNEWKNKNNIGDYIVLYFLNEPSSAVKKTIKSFAEKYRCKMVAFPYRYKFYNELSGIIYSEIGPKEFITIIKNAKCVLTDSFHGTAFSINLGVPFWTFERQYGTNSEQSTRIVSLLEIVGLTEQYCENGQCRIEVPRVDFKHVQEVLNNQRKKSNDYMLGAIRKSLNMTEGGNCIE